MATREPVKNHPGVYKIVGTYVNRFVVVVDVGRDPETDKRRQRSRRFETLQEALDFQTKTRHSRREGSYVESSDQPLGAYLDAWLDSLRRPGPATRLAYTTQIRRITSVLGDVPLGDLTPAMCDRLIAELLARGLAPKTVREAGSLLTRALERAVRRQQLARNPATDVELPPLTRRPLTVWSAAEVRRFLAATADERDGPLWHLACMTGLRLGEMLALRWDALDLETGHLRVIQHLTHTAPRTQEIIAPSAKTDAGYREIVIPASTIGALRMQHYRQSAWRDAAADGWVETGLVFTRPDGSLQRPQAVLSRFYAATKRHEMPPLRIHDLRHTAATLMLTEARLPLFVVSRILGHRSIQITADRYGHLLTDAQRSAAVEFERAIWSVPDISG